MTIHTLPVASDDPGDLFDADLPELDLIAADVDDPDAAVRFAFLDPNWLAPNSINRTFTDADLADLLASVPVVGFLQAAVVVPIDDDPQPLAGAGAGEETRRLVEDEPLRYRVLIGNRRRAVAERLGRPLPCLIVRSGDSVQEILAILSENDDRLALKPTEKADLYQQLTLLEWTPAQIAKARGVKTAEVRACLSLVELPAAARTAADSGQLALDVAADLAEFEDDPKTLAKIIEKGTSAWGFRHAISDARVNRSRKQAADRLFAELTLAGVKVVGKPKGFGYGGVKEVAATSLCHADGQRLDEETVKTLPGFAAFVDKSAYGGPKAVIFCTDPERYGYTRTGHSSYVSEAEQAERDAAAAALQARRLALDTAAQVRREFLIACYGNPRAAKAHQQQALRAAIADPDAVAYNGSYAELADTIAGVRIADYAETAGADRLARMLVARWVTAAEQNLTHLAAGRTWDVDPAAAVAHLDRLVAAGYALSDAEQHLHTELTTVPAQTDDDEAEESDDEADDPDGEEADDDHAAGEDDDTVDGE